MSRHIKRVHEEPQPLGGIWGSLAPLLPRGTPQSETHPGVLCRAIASGANVRRDGFCSDHFAELSTREEMLNKIHKRIWPERARPLDGVRDSTFNNARALAEHLSRKR